MTKEQQTDNTAQPETPSAAPPAPAKFRHGRTVLVRYGKMALLGLFRHNERHFPYDKQYVIIHTDRGMELGEILSPFCHRRGTCELTNDRIEEYCQRSGANYPLSRKGRFVRFATDQDINENWHLEKQAQQEAQFCSELIARHELPMRLVAVEHLFGGDRIIYYFMADGRVDFRGLVKELAHEYQTRIEMRQVGARDEARIIADYETCGRECCCKNFLKVLQPVNMRMAKLQKATLDPSKISGRCGRLKCCLRYEDELYTELNKNLPRNNTCVLTGQGPGVVVETQVITQLVKVQLDGGAVIAVSVDELLDRNHQRPAAPVPAKPNVEPAQHNLPTPNGSQNRDDPAEATESQRRKKRRRRRRKKSSPQDEATSAAPDAAD